MLSSCDVEFGCSLTNWKAVTLKWCIQSNGSFQRKEQAQENNVIKPRIRHDELDFLTIFCK